MTDLEKAARLVVLAFEAHRTHHEHGCVYLDPAIELLRKVILEAEQPAQQEPVTILPDGSAFAVMSYPLPKNHWLYADRQYNDGEYEPVELGKPILTHELSDIVVSAVRYAIRGATNCGKEMDFDPDALVQNTVYALCGPFTSPQPAKQCVDCNGMGIQDGKGNKCLSCDGHGEQPAQQDEYVSEDDTEELIAVGALPEPLRLAVMLEETMQSPLHGKAADCLRKLHAELKGDNYEERDIEAKLKEKNT